MSIELQSKLEGVGYSIFSVMSQLAAKEGAINLAQGFPDFGGDQKLVQLASQYMNQGYNQYAPMKGILPLRQQIAHKANALYDTHLQAEDITITCGATQALYTAISAVVSKGDEIIIIEPAYDSYAAAIRSHQGIVVPVHLDLDSFKLDLDKVRGAITSRTRLIVLNSPHNPTGSILYTADFLQQLYEIVETHGLLVLSDEVYEHMVYDGAKHHSVLSHEGLASRSFCVFSFGKTFHFTGWKMGYVVAPPRLMEEFRKHHQYTVFSVLHPFQHAIADFLEDPHNYLYLSDFFEEKRDLLAGYIAQSELEWKGSEGTYFGLMEYPKDYDMDDLAFAKYLTREKKVAVIPLSPFFTKAPEHRLVRICFAKKSETLQEAGEKLLV